MLTADRTSKATLRRSVRLFRLFLREQSDPAGFYSAFADDSVAALGQFVSLADKTVLDVGGGPGYFARSFQAAGARYVGVELDALSDMPAETFAVHGSGTSLPFRDGSVDLAYCSNVLEHVAEPWQVAAELVRVTRPGGTIFVSFTPWLSPWGGHETAPWHYLGGIATDTNRRTASASRCSPIARPTRWRGLVVARRPIWWPGIRVTTPVDCAGSWRCRGCVRCSPGTSHWCCADDERDACRATGCR